jgi:hypothetical protein
VTLYALCAFAGLYLGYRLTGYLVAVLFEWHGED